MTCYISIFGPERLRSNSTYRLRTRNLRSRTSVSRDESWGEETPDSTRIDVDLGVVCLISRDFFFFDSVSRDEGSTLPTGTRGENVLRRRVTRVTGPHRKRPVVALGLAKESHMVTRNFCGPSWTISRGLSLNVSQTLQKM